MIRKATATDLEEITAIYNEAVHTTTATLDTETKTPKEQQAWFSQHGVRYPILVAELDGAVVGWVSISAWSDRCAYSDTGETSFYVAASCQGKGIGRQLLAAITDEARKLEYHSLLARMAEGSDASVHLHKQLGFELVGVLKQVGRKFGKLLDVEVYQLLLGD